MRHLLSSRNLFILGFALVVLANAALLLGVALNRKGETTARVVLTERELSLPYRQQAENSAMRLRLKWRVIDGDHMEYAGGSPSWFTAGKARELGLPVESVGTVCTPRERYKQPIPREAYIVLEYEGPLYQAAIDKAERAVAKAEAAYKKDREAEKESEAFRRSKEWLQREHTSASRLFAVDAGINREKLHQQYNDPARFIITQGRVTWRTSCSQNQQQGSGSIAGLDIDTIHIPLEVRTLFEDFLKQGQSHQTQAEPRYAITLAYGSRYEPWIAGVQPLNHKAQ